MLRHLKNVKSQVQRRAFSSKVEIATIDEAKRQNLTILYGQHQKHKNIMNRTHFESVWTPADDAIIAKIYEKPYKSSGNYFTELFYGPFYEMNFQRHAAFGFAIFVGIKGCELAFGSDDHGHGHGHGHGDDKHHH